MKDLAEYTGNELSRIPQPWSVSDFTQEIAPGFGGVSHYPSHLSSRSNAPAAYRQLRPVYKKSVTRATVDRVITFKLRFGYTGKERNKAEAQAQRELREFVFYAANRLLKDWALPRGQAPAWRLDPAKVQMVWSDSGRFHRESHPPLSPRLAHH